MLSASYVRAHHVAATTGTPSPLCLNGTRYVVTFDDEFSSFRPYDPATGRGVWDTAYTWGRMNPGARDAAMYVDPGFGVQHGVSLGLNPFSVSGDGLTITARVAPPAVAALPGRPAYVSGVITTAHSFSQTYGYFEARMRLSRGRGLWPSFWMLPVIGYPPEIDVMEILGQEPARVYQTTHAVDKSTQQIVSTEANPDGFHSYGVAWAPSTITYYVDGRVTGTVGNISNQPMYLLANLQVGGVGSWPGTPDASTTFPTSATIRYVRGYEAAGACPVH
ncbi:MAG TPA: glycoside hydrolase family 16 protein [Candidatus Sulfotelmatobacter sp.]|nr:glycoside hydrolase family 16 protein [Candidatus Sulfotelmatobacter sp.]